jgi:uncharacterized protein YecE (DUF72 family)
MEFGKINEPDLIDWSLPEHFKYSGKDQKSKRLFKIYLGCPLWGHDGFKGSLYPHNAKKNEYLNFYQQSFQSIEFNSSFYSLPSMDQIDQWRNMISPEFKFCPKFPKLISQSIQIDEMIPYFKRVINEFKYFGPHLGLSFLQLGQHLGPSILKRLLRLLKEVPGDFSLSLELRNDEWVNSNELIELQNFLKQKDISLVMTDTGGRRDLLTTAFLSSKMMIRFLGNSLHPTDYARIKEWSDIIKSWQYSQVEEVYFFFHQASEEQGIPLAQKMLELLSEFDIQHMKDFSQKQVIEDNQLSFNFL